MPSTAGATGNAAQTDTANPTAARRWCSGGKFQIISAGLDDEFGDGPDLTTPLPEARLRFSESGDNLSKNDGDFDNLTSFAGGRLENEIKQ